MRAGGAGRVCGSTAPGAAQFLGGSLYEPGRAGDSSPAPSPVGGHSGSLTRCLTRHATRLGPGVVAPVANVSERTAARLSAFPHGGSPLSALGLSCADARLCPLPSVSAFPHFPHFDLRGRGSARPGAARRRVLPGLRRCGSFASPKGVPAVRSASGSRRVVGRVVGVSRGRPCPRRIALDLVHLIGCPGRGCESLAPLPAGPIPQCRLQHREMDRGGIGTGRPGRGPFGAARAPPGGPCRLVPPRSGVDAPNWSPRVAGWWHTPADASGR